MKHSKHSTLQRKLLGLAIAACFGSAQANPVAPRVVAGQASFTQQGNVFTVANTPNTIINWQSFSIGADEVTRFLQQGAASKVLNRISGQDPSRILGSLQSNGQVYLLNPNGVLFGQGARIDVQGLVASSLALSDADFLAGRMRFTGAAGAGKVENQGQIATRHGGQVYLVAPQVENSGIIQAPGGAVMLAAGHSVQLVDSANPALQVVVSAPADQALNLGQLVAQGGRVGIFGALVKQRGTVSADSAVRGAQGQVLLRASGSTMLEGGSRTTARGGEIAILGQQVGLTGDARVDASGEEGGGSVLVGGDYRGANPQVPNARQVYVGRDAVLTADAGSSGRGGKVVVWADETARVHGSISARGGRQGGDGGLVETSARQLELGGLRVDAGAVQGRLGQWLLDPYDIEVKVAPGVPATLTDVANFNAGNPSGVTELATALLNGATADVTLQAKHDITFVDPVAIGAPGVGLLAQAGNHIMVKGRLATNGGMLRLQANDPASGTASGSGAVKLTAGLETGMGAIELSGAEIDVGPGVLVAGREQRWKADSMRIASGAQVQAANSVSLNPYSLTTAIKLGEASDGTPGVLALDGAELSAINTQNLNIGFGQHYGTLSIDGLLDLAASNAGNAMLTLASNAIAVNGALKPRSGVSLQTSGALAGNGSITAPVLLVNAGSVALTGPNQVMGLAAMATGDISFNNVGNLNLTYGNGLTGVQTSGNLSLKASSLNQEYGMPLRAASLTLDGSGQVNLSGGNNQVNILRAQGVGNLNYFDSGSLEVQAVSQADSASTGGFGNLHVAALGTLVVSGAVNGNGKPVQLEGGSLRLAPTAMVSGGPMLLRANNGSLASEVGAQVNATDVGLEANAMSLAGQTSASNSIRVSSLGGGTITVGGTPTSDSGGLVVGNADLGRLSAPNLLVGGGFFDPNGNPVPNASHITANQLDLSGSSLLKSLVLQTGGNVDLIGSVKLPAGAGLGAEAGGTLSNTAMVSAQSIKLRGGSVVLSGAAGTGMAAEMIGIDSAGTVELGGDRPSGTPNTHLSGAGLASLKTPRLFIAAASGMKVGGAVSLPGRELELEARSGSLQVAAPLQADVVHLNADAMDFTADVMASLASLTPATPGYSITIGAACGTACLSLTQLNRIAAGTLGIGNRDDGSDAPIPGTKPGTATSGTGGLPGWGAGAIHIGGAANLNALTTRLGLITTAGITQDTANAAAALKVQELGIDAGAGVQLDHSGNQVARLAAVVSSGNLDFRSSQALSVVRLQGGNSAGGSGYDINGIQLAGTATLRSDGALATDGAAIRASKLVAKAGANIGTAAAALQTFVAELDAESTATSGAAPIYISNNAGKPAPLSLLQLKLASGNSGEIVLDNYGALTLASGGVVSSDSGNIRLTAHSPLSIFGSVLSNSGDILLEAAGTGSDADDLTIASGALVKSNTGNVKLAAGSDVNYVAGTVQAPGGSIGVNGTIVTPPVQPPTSVDQCQLDPSLPGCQLVLPPTEAQPTNPVQQAISQTIQVINSAAAAPGEGAVAVSPDEGKDKQAKKDDKGDKLAQDQTTGAKKNEPATKMYCN
ncbi:filamentous hemagglutinin N-terminal domain-containing protein [Pseudoduganella sp. R-34]|uniref:two-partner secretion domain-containing protein n=1 Tax=Pseudoduganella sp. R-34 TaxID=3404062 RepID=UPI003CF6E758